MACKSSFILNREEVSVQQEPILDFNVYKNTKTTEAEGNKQFTFREKEVDTNFRVLTNSLSKHERVKGKTNVFWG